MRYRVVAPYVTVKTDALAGTTGVAGKHSGISVIGVYQDGLLPSGVPDSDLERLLRKRMIEEVG